jgi:hypothetical protein
MHGNKQRAKKAIQVALGLAPTNRHVLRSAACFFVHVGDPERAHDTLVSAPNVSHDPWLAAAEIATASSAGRTSRLFKKARDNVRDSAYSNRDIAELATAIATVELSSGNARQSKKLFKIGLADPTENAMAQAEWATRVGKLNLDLSSLDLVKPRAYEAIAINTFATKDWTECANATSSWMDDQPFLSKPALSGSVVASDLLFDDLRAVEFTRRGLKSNPTDSMLHNNEAVAFARLHKLRSARVALDRAIGYSDPSDDIQQIVLTATRGLLAFRNKHAEAGRILYERAIEKALGLKHYRLATRALIYYLLEEAMFEPSNSPSVLHWLNTIASSHRYGEHFQWFVDAIKGRIETVSKLSEHFPDSSGIKDRSGDVAQKLIGAITKPQG